MCLDDMDIKNWINFCGIQIPHHRPNSLRYIYWKKEMSEAHEQQCLFSSMFQEIRHAIQLFFVHAMLLFLTGYKL